MHTVLRTDTQRIPVIDGDFDTTVAIPAPWLRPPVTSRHITPRARLASRWQQFLAGQYVADVHAGWQRALAVLGALGIGYFVLAVGRGAWVTVELLGLHAVPRDLTVFYGCLAITALSGIALLLLRNPRSFLSRLVDRPDENATREVQS